MYKVKCNDHIIYDPEFENLKIFNPVLELELNHTNSFSFTIYPEHPYFDIIEKLTSIIQVYKDDEIVFRGRVLNDTQGFYNQKEVYCEGELAFLCDSIQRPYDFQSGTKHTTVPDLFKFFINNHNSQVGTEKQFKIGQITVTDPNDYIVRSDSTYLNTWNSIGQKLIEPLGGFLRVRHENDGNYIDYLADSSEASNQRIEFGKNLLDFNRQIKAESIATAIIPLGARIETTEETTEEKRVTIASLPNDETGEICKKDDYVYSKSAVNQYGWIFASQTWDDITVASNLLSTAKSFVSSAANLLFSIELKAFDLTALNVNFDAFKLGQYVRVYDYQHGINNNFLIRKLSIALDNPDQNVLTVGTEFSSFTEQSHSSFSNVNTQIQQSESQGEIVTPVEDRKSATLMNGWSNYGGGFEQAVFWKDRSVVHISGIIKNGYVSPGTVIFTLPTGYRPRLVERFLIPSVNEKCEIEIMTSGEIVIRSGAKRSWLDLCGITFRV